MPPPATELRKAESPEEAEARRRAALDKRQERAALKKKVESESIRHAVPDAAKSCPKCGGTADRPVGDGKTTTEYEYLPGRFKRIEHTQEKLACNCGQYIATAPPPPRALDKSLYGPGFIAHLVTMKCADAIPLHRLAKQYQRVGIPMSRSTLNDLFHATAIKVTALSTRLLQVIAESRIVLADETPLVMQRPNKRGYIWTFITGKLIAYRFSASRSGKTAASVLGGTSGTLVVDAYTGYNRVTEPEGRERAGCNAHARRGFFDALSSSSVEARKALDLFLEIYRVEHEAKARGIVRVGDRREARKSGRLAAGDGEHRGIRGGRGTGVGRAEAPA